MQCAPKGGFTGKLRESLIQQANLEWPPHWSASLFRRKSRCTRMCLYSQDCQLLNGTRFSPGRISPWRTTTSVPSRPVPKPNQVTTLNLMKKNTFFQFSIVLLAKIPWSSGASSIYGSERGIGARTKCITHCKAVVQRAKESLRRLSWCISETSGLVIPPPEGHIMNGNVAYPGQFPWQAGIYLDGKQFCGGSLIAQKVVLTAAHCVTG